MKNIFRKIIRVPVAILFIPAILIGGLFISMLEYATDGTQDMTKEIYSHVIVLAKWLVFIDAEIT